MYIDDVIDLFILLINKIDSFENKFYQFKVGSEQHLTIREFVISVKKLCENTETNLLFGAIPYRKNEVMSSNKTDLTKLYQIGWEQKYSTEDGLKKTIKEYKNEKR